jgi:hypothetical protein
VAGKPAEPSHQQQHTPPDGSHQHLQQQQEQERNAQAPQEQWSEQSEQLQQQMNSLHQQVAADSSAVQQPIQQQQQAPLAARSATPLPRPRAAKLWDIAVNDLGVLQGMPEPQEVSVRVQQLLQRVQQQESGCRQHQSHQQQEGGAASSSPSSNGGSSSSSSGCGDVSWSEQDVELLLSARGVDMTAVVAAADALRSTVCGDVVSYVVNRNINYTNVCTYACKFCAFSKVRWSWLGRAW